VVKKSYYFDSVTLMNIARDMRALPGIEDAALVMGTEANKGLLKQAKMFMDDINSATANDLVLVLKGTDEAVENAIARVESSLTKRSTPSLETGQHQPRTIRTAIQSQPDANLVVISVAGQYAAAEAWEALHRGLHVLLFSDNVPLADEVALKRYAVEHGLLMMGPGAGTAILNGVALGFANVVPSGPVGIISAAGTGLQEVSCLLANRGIGISQGVGVGGRDLSDEVGGMMMLHALDFLQQDTDTEILILISKRPSKKVSETVLAKLHEGEKSAVVIFMGKKLTQEEQIDKLEKLIIFHAQSLYEATIAAEILLKGGELSTLQDQLADETRELEQIANDLRSRLKPSQSYLRGLFSGGTLCQEAIQIWSEQLGPIWSNAPLDPEHKLPKSNQSREHTALDLGEEEFTVGRPHPMIDNELRIRRLLKEARDPAVAVIQMDIVLGFGAHPNPAGELSPAILEAKKIAGEQDRPLIIVTAITGTKHDPQNFELQRSLLENANAIVMHNNALASSLSARLVDPDYVGT
jgi:succinyl-CoA synthetase alpha subunit